MVFVRQNCRYCHESTISNGRPVASGWVDSNESEESISPSKKSDCQNVILDNTVTQNRTSILDSKQYRLRRRRWVNCHRSVIVMLIFFLIDIQQRNVHGAPVACGPSCRRGTCRGAALKNDTTSHGFLDYSTNDIIDSVVDNDTAQPSLYINTFNGNVSTPKIKDISNSSDIANSSPQHRLRRQSYVKSRACSSRFQLEIIAIPVSIMMIPVALCGLLLCVFCCGPKDSRGKIPESCLGFVGRRRNDIAHGNHDLEDFEYGDGYVQRKNSKKTRFATDVQVYVDDTSSVATNSHHQRMDNSGGESLASRQVSATNVTVSLPTEAENQCGVHSRTVDNSWMANNHSDSLIMTAIGDRTSKTIIKEATTIEEKCSPKMQISVVSVNNSTTSGNINSSNKSEYLQRTRF